MQIFVRCAFFLRNNQKGRSVTYNTLYQWHITRMICHWADLYIYHTRDDHYPVCQLDIRKDNEFATGYGYPKTAFKWEPDPDIRNTFIDISRIHTFGKTCTLHNHSYIVFRSIFFSLGRERTKKFNPRRALVYNQCRNWRGAGVRTALTEVITEPGWILTGVYVFVWSGNGPGVGILIENQTGAGPRVKFSVLAGAREPICFYCRLIVRLISWLYSLCWIGQWTIQGRLGMKEGSRLGDFVLDGA